MTTTVTPADTQATAVRQASRLRLVAVGLGASALTIATLLATHPWGTRIDSSSDEVFVYDKIQPHRSGVWGGLLLDGLALGVLGVCLALAVCHLVRGRGRVPATIGAVLTVVGGILSAMGGLAFATLGWYATALPEESTADLVRYVNDHPGHAMVADMAGFVAFTLGSLVLAFALFRSKAVPSAGLAVFVLLTVALFAVSGSATGSDVVQIVQTLVVGALAIPLWRKA